MLSPEIAMSLRIEKQLVIHCGRFAVFAISFPADPTSLFSHDVAIDLGLVIVSNKVSAKKNLGVAEIGKREQNFIDRHPHIEVSGNASNRRARTLYDRHPA